jgi:hypothetical protein
MERELRRQAINEEYFVGALVLDAMASRNFNSNKLFTYCTNAGGYSSRRNHELSAHLEAPALPWFGSMGSSFESDTPQIVRRGPDPPQQFPPLTSRGHRSPGDFIAHAVEEVLVMTRYALGARDLLQVPRCLLLIAGPTNRDYAIGIIGVVPLNA